jgi:hypothetical protein
MLRKNENMLEDEVIEILITWLKKDDWNIVQCCKGRERGIDILAQKGKRLFIIEAKGAKGNPGNKSTRPKFNSSQVNTHLGVAILKVLRERIKYPEAKIAIAHPDTPYIRERVVPLIPDLQKTGIRFLWISANGQVEG